MRRVALSIATSALAVSTFARAQGGDHAVPTGGRSALTGNTGVALARDGAAPFLNPATIAGVADSQVAFSVNIYSVTATTIDQFHAPRGTTAGLGRATLTDARLDALPSTFCLFLTLGKIAVGGADEASRRKLAVCAGTTERAQLSASASATGDAPDGRHSLHIASLERTYGRVHVGPTYGFGVTDAFAIGASLHLVDTNLASLTTANASSYGGASADATSSGFSSSSTATSFDIAGLLGATWQIDRATTLGLAFGLPSLHVAGSVDVADYSSSGDFSRTRAGSGRFSAPLPMRLAVGVGRHTKKASIEVDATYFFAQSDAFRSDIDVHSVTNRGPAWEDRMDSETASTRDGAVLDSAVGGELFVSDSISLLGGFATDFATTPRLPASAPFGNVVMTSEQRLIATFGVGSYGAGSELLFGAQLALARGQTFVGDSYTQPSDLAPVNQYTTTVLFVIAGSTSLSTIRRTLEDLRHTIPIR